MSNWTAADQLAQEERYAAVDYRTLVELFHHVKRAADGDLFVLRVLEIYIEPRFLSEQVFKAHRLATPNGARAIAKELSDMKAYYDSRHVLASQDATGAPAPSAFRQLYETVEVLVSNMRSPDAVFGSIGGAISPNEYERTSLAGLRVRAFYQLRRVAIATINGRTHEVLHAPETDSDRLLNQLTEDLLAACRTTHAWVSLEVRTKAQRAQAAIQDNSSLAWRSRPSLDFKFIYWRNVFILSVLTAPASPYEPGARAAAR